MSPSETKNVAGLSPVPSARWRNIAGVSSCFATKGRALARSDQSYTMPL